MTDRIRLLYLSSSLSVGGAEQLILGLAQHLDRSRFDVHICGLANVRGNRLQPAFERLDLPVHVVGARHFYDPRSLLAVAGYVRTHHVDLIHTHLLDADVVGRLAGRLLRRPVVSTLHNQPWDYERRRLGRGRLAHLTARHLNVELVAVSERIREMYIRAWGIPDTRIRTIYNGIAIEPFLAVPAGTPATESGPLITTVGRLSPQKGHSYLLDAAQTVLRHHPTARFLIVGQGRLEQQLKAQVAALGIADRVTFAGVRDDIPEILGRTDVFVLSSLWEGLPLTAVEAMAAARPVVLTDVGGTSELVESGTQGVIVPPADAPALAEALCALLDAPDKRMALGRAARRRVASSFTMQRYARQHEALYTSMLGISSTPAPLEQADVQ